MPDLTGRKLDAAVAVEVIGLEVHIEPSGNVFVWAGTAKRHTFRTHSIDYRWCPAYSTSHDAVATVRAEIERRGLVVDFMIHLNTIHPETWQGMMVEIQWRAMNASPEQQCRAALAAVRGAK